MIYLILCAGFKDNNPDLFEKRLKIGYTDNLENRLKAYSTTNPDYILLQTREGDTTVESYLHKKFEKYKYKDCREWFCYDQDIIDNFQCNIEDYIDEDLLLDCIKKDLRLRISSITELREKYLNQILEEIKSSDNFSEELYEEEIIVSIITNIWNNGIDYFNSSIDLAKLVDYKPIDLFNNCDNEVDITVEVNLPQILGRQRLECNPWKNRAELYIRFLSESNKKTGEEFKKYQKSKISKTNNLLLSYNSSPTKESKHDLAENYQKVAKTYNYKDDYVAVNTHSGSDLIPIFNNLVMISELRAFEIQQIDYPDRFRIINQINSSGKYEFDPVMIEVETFLSKFRSIPYFIDKMKLLCESNLSKEALSTVLKQVHVDYSTYYTVLGPERIKTFGYQKSKLSTECDKILINSKADIKEIDNTIISTFCVGSRVSYLEAKSLLKNIYTSKNLKKTARATDLENYFEVKKVKIPIDGKRVDGYEILKLRDI